MLKLTKSLRQEYNIKNLCLAGGVALNCVANGTLLKEKTGCPVIVNTSFNVRGEPIVNTPTDAFNCFMGTELDYLVIGNCILDKLKQSPDLKNDYNKEFDLD